MHLKFGERKSKFVKPSLGVCAGRAYPHAGRTLITERIPTLSQVSSIEHSRTHYLHNRTRAAQHNHIVGARTTRGAHADYSLWIFFLQFYHTFGFNLNVLTHRKLDFFK